MTSRFYFRKGRLPLQGLNSPSPYRFSAFFFTSFVLNVCLCGYHLDLQEILRKNNAIPGFERMTSFCGECIITWLDRIFFNEHVPITDGFRPR